MAYLLRALLGLAVSCWAPIAWAAEVPTDARIYGWRRAWNWCGPSHEVGALPGLDDSGCVKRFPAVFDRDFTCPTLYRANASGMFGPPARNLSAPMAHLDRTARLSYRSSMLALQCGRLQRMPSR